MTFIQASRQPGSAVALLRPLAYVQRAAYASSSTAGPSRRRKDAPPPDPSADLVAPPDPVSNIRPIVYASDSFLTRPTSLSSPYSTNEFPYSDADSRMKDVELEWKLRRERTDMMNHRFWATINTDFNAQLSNRLSALPPPSDPPSETDVALRDAIETEFYADWLAANRYRQSRWVGQWWRALWGGLKMDLRMHLTRFFWRFRRT